jgi:hypothetical protein
LCLLELIFQNKDCVINSDLTGNKVTDVGIVYKNDDNNNDINTKITTMITRSLSHIGSDFGWDWGPAFVPVGVYGGISFEQYNGGELGWFL